MFNFKFNNPAESFTLGLSCHLCERITEDQDTGDITTDEVYFLTIGFLIFNIEIMW